MSRRRKSRQHAREAETPPIVSEFSASRPPVSASARPTALVARALALKGEIKAKADLTVEGCVDGCIDAPGQTLTIGVTGRATANVRARTVIVRGMVVGNIEATDRVEVHPTGTVCGDVTAERLVLAEGSSFNGSVNLGAGAHPLADDAPMIDATTGDGDHVDAEVPPAPLAMWTLRETGEA